MESAKAAMVPVRKRERGGNTMSPLNEPPPPLDEPRRGEADDFCWQTGTWQLPGGHLEYQEKIFRCAEREAEEETGLVVKGSTIAAVTNDVFAEDGKHYVTLFVHCGMADDDAKPRVSHRPHTAMATVAIMARAQKSQLLTGSL